MHGKGARTASRESVAVDPAPPPSTISCRKKNKNGCETNARRNAGDSTGRTDHIVCGDDAALSALVLGAPPVRVEGNILDDQGLALFELQVLL